MTQFWGEGEGPTLNIRINWLHEQLLRIVYNDNKY